jgi:hypothetical protein
MYFLLVNLYEFGQFLRIFLWISLPMMTITMLVTTYFHYRKRRVEREGLVFSVDGYSLSVGDVENQTTEWSSGGDPAGSPENGEALSQRDGDTGDEDTDRHNENMYRGILWMKEKYEQYRDLADKRYEQLREELDQAEKRYQDLLVTLEESKAGVLSGGLPADGRGSEGAGAVALLPGGDVESISIREISDVEKDSIRDIVEEKDRQIQFLQGQLEQRIKNYHQLEYQGRDNKAHLEELEKQYAEARQALEERQRIIDDKNGSLAEMEGVLLIERNKVEELVAKLQHNSLLLMNIYKELDKSLNIERPAENPA